MKHTIKITTILLTMFFITQLVGLLVVHIYSPDIKQELQNGTLVNQTIYNMPYGVNPPDEINPGLSLLSLAIAITVAVGLMFTLMYIKAETFLRYWFFVVVVFASAITINSFIIGLQLSSIIAGVVGIILAYFKVFKRNMVVHNITEVLVYPGIASIMVPLFNIWSVVILLVLISFYDMYAVWHSGIMQKMAKYQINKVRVFSGFYVPYLMKGERKRLEKMKKSKKKNQKVKMSVAILGGGDVVFPIILAGVVLRTWGIIPALFISVIATVALAYLFYFSKKGKFYPAMPFISTGCFIGLIIGYLIA